DIAKQIILKGEIHLTTEQRRRLMEEKRRRVITFIARNAVNPQTGLPHPATRIEIALEEVRVNFDPFKSVDELVKETVKALRPILPIRFEERKIAVRFPMDCAARAFGAVSGAAYVTMDKNEWQNDGSWICVVKIPAGMQEEFFSLANQVAKGDAHIKILE
ncbi:MAG TPA: ribosome assembly factor SBDS, partial [Methanocorpusculum sp.]|nr:ribosome assembly factor SBDS [Methanocorpusculum sp.]